jgi:alkylation response protein AidB-like acyl-CoA dehydrogenase
MIDLNLTAEQRQIVDSLRTMLARHYPVERLRIDNARADNLKEIEDFGAFILSLPEEAGGGGMSAVEDMLIQTELGRHLVSPHALALPVALHLCQDAGRGDLLDALASGEKKVALGNTIGAYALHLLDADAADYALVWDPASVTLVDISRLERFVTASAIAGVGIARSAYSDDNTVISMTADQTRAVLLAKLLVSAQLLGISQAARDLSVDYAKLRTQFGQPIGTFQAIKHRCADMAIRSEAHSAQLTFAALAVSGDWPDAAFQVDAAWLLACRYAVANTRSAIQIHGGIGFSAECDAHLYLLRAQLLENLGSVGSRREAELCRQPAQAWAIA